MKRIASPVGIICLIILSAGRSYAQPYATNVVGYVNTTYPVGWSLIANPLDSGPGNSLTSLFGNTLPQGSTIYTWSGGVFLPHYYDVGLYNGWSSGGDTLVPGQGALLYLPSTPSQPIHTWVGSILGIDWNTERPLPVTPPAPGVWLLSSVAPVNNRTFEGVIGRAPNDLDSVLTVAPSGVASISIYDSGQAWWVDPLGNHVTDPTVTLAYSAFFDLTGNSFAGFLLPSEVPEPTTSCLLALGSAAVCAWRRRASVGPHS